MNIHTPLLALAVGMTLLAPVVQDSGTQSTSDNPMVGGMAMVATKNIVENAMNSKDHTTLVSAVKAAGLVEALQAEGPFTVFAPTNDAFENLPQGTVENLLKPESKEQLTKVLTYHVAAGNWTSDKLRSDIQAGGGKVEITTLAGGKLTAMMNGTANIVIKDEAGNTASISTYDVKQSNGVIHVVNAVLLPKM
jgi:uncharacterized surface protein with fasciclin (FAS1) repeats